VSERPVTNRRGPRGGQQGTLKEGWGTGTAAVISPVVSSAFQRDRIVVNGGRIGELTQRLYDTIVGIQYGTAPDPARMEGDGLVDDRVGGRLHSLFRSPFAAAHGGWWTG